MLIPRRRWRMAAVATAVLVAVVAPGPAAPVAAADEPHPCPLNVDDYGSTIEWAMACVDHFAQHGGGGADGDERVCQLDPNPWGIPIVCLHESYGWWSNSLACYLRPASPQPDPGEPEWGGHDPDDGVVNRLTCPWLDGIDGQPYWEWAFPRFFPAHGGMLGHLVERAVAQLVVTGPDIRLAPDPDGVGLVGLPVWMWTEVNERTWSPEPVSLSALGWTVVVEADVDRIVWDLGNGDTVVCDQGPGTPYQDHFGAQPSPDCGYDGYAWPSRMQPDGTYEVTATTHWVVHWRFDGTSVNGRESAQRQSSTSVRIHELQVVTS